MTVISFSEENKKKIEENKRKEKHTGRFRVTIDTYESPKSTLVSYYITVEDFGCSGDVDVIFATYRLYHGSNPYKEAEKMIDEIKRKEKYTTKTETYYVD
ncbi:hypothetical protein ACRPK2_08685 [Lactococcus garvieae]|uniref:hypothetical protein n=1 Tax=Lactococcus garvieae TaxID=1363 RepID=UPI003D76C783